MQLRQSVALLRRFWIVIVMLPLVVGIVSVVVEQMKPPRYVSVTQLIISQEPVPQGQQEAFPDVNLTASWESSGYILDDLPQVVTSFALAQDISTWLAVQGYQLSPATIQASLDAETFHRSVTITSQADSPELAMKLLEGVTDKLKSNGLNYWSRATKESDGLSIAVLDPPSAAQNLHNTRWLILNVGLRVGLALAAAIALVFLLAYLDQTVREPYQVETWVGLPVVGVLPKEER